MPTKASTKYPPLRKLTPDEQKLVADNMGLASMIAGKYARALASKYGGYKNWHAYCNQFFDELVDAGWVGLCIGAQRFDKGRKNKFSTFAIWWVRAQVHIAECDCELRSGTNKSERKTRIREFGGFATSSNDDFQVDAPDYRDTYQEWDQAPPELMALLNFVLDKRSVSLVRLRVLNELSLHEVGKLHGITKERVRQLVNKAMDRLRACPGVVQALEAQAERRRRSADVDRSFSWKMAAIA